MAAIFTIYYLLLAFPLTASSLGETMAGLFASGVFTYERVITEKTLQK